MELEKILKYRFFKPKTDLRSFFPDLDLRYCMSFYNHEPEFEATFEQGLFPAYPGHLFPTAVSLSQSLLVAGSGVYENVGYKTWSSR